MNTNRKHRKFAWMAAAGAAATIASLVPSGGAAHADDGVIADFQGTTRLGVAQNAWHWWGQCRVRDMNGGTWGWYLRESTGVYAPTYRVHHGMLAGYTAIGGPGAIGCATSDEFAWGNGVRQNFSGGYLYWQNGMSRAVAAINGTAAKYALDRLGQVRTTETSNGYWSGWCLRFAYLASGKAWSQTDNAAAEWRLAASRGLGHANDRNVPRNAVVYYTWSTLGHAGVSLGDGWVVSTAGTMGQALAVRIHRIDDVSGYLGWAWAM